MIATTAFERLTVADVMTLDPIVVEVGDTIERAEELFTLYRITGLPVVDASGELVGVISQSDLLGEGNAWMSCLIRGNASGLRVGELMTTPAITVAMTTSLQEAARLMRDERVHRLVVTGAREHPIGVLSATDFVTLVADA